jgi:exopolysaccharide biosynthesis polyprenyl glycosylphosphotransferase
LWAGLYKSQLVQNLFEQFSDITKASLLSGLLILAFFYYINDRPYSRKLLVIFMGMLLVGLFFSHVLTMTFLRFLRKRGYNLRYYAVIGAGKKGQTLVEDIKKMGWLGLNCLFFIDNAPELIGTEQLGIPVYGPVEKLPELVKTRGLDEIYFALGGDEAQRAYPILRSLQYSGVTIRIIPDWGNLLSMSKPAVVPIGSQLLFSAADSPLSGKKIVFKQVFDFVVTLAILIVVSIPMLVIALLIKLSSKGPVFYKQTRVGMDQREFDILKFRTMKSDAEEENGPQWSKPNDVRCTPIGKWLRRTSLDELPQLINVVKGQMSLVGPRPERPCFAKQFSGEYRKYMLRHKVKTGITGWAQINGFRGSTSLRKRLLYDLYYVRNWSFGFDLWIFLCTPWHVIKGENAH